MLGDNFFAVENTTKQPTSTGIVISGPMTLLKKLLSVFDLDMPHDMEVDPYAGGGQQKDVPTG